MKAYYILRKDLNMSAAKLAIQVGHGTDLIYMNVTSNLEEWVKDHRRKIVLQVDNEAILQSVENILKSRNVAYQFIIDKGFTEFNGETITGIVVFPTNNVPGMIKHLPTYK